MHALYHVLQCILSIVQDIYKMAGIECWIGREDFKEFAEGRNLELAKMINLIGEKKKSGQQDLHYGTLMLPREPIKKGFRNGEG